MDKLLLFWMINPPHPEMEVEAWGPFRASMAGWLVLMVLLVVGMIGVLYYVSSRRLKIHIPADVFRPYTPLKWLWLTLVSGVVLFLVYRHNYLVSFPDAPASFMGRAVGLALWGMFLTFLLSVLVMASPRMTPAKFRYRPFAIVYRRRRAQS